MSEISTTHQITPDILWGFVAREKLAGSSVDAGGKMLILETSIDQAGHVINSFEVWSNTTIMAERIIHIRTRVLDEAIDKYNIL